MKILGKIAVWTAVSISSAIVGAVVFIAAELISEINEPGFSSGIIKNVGDQVREKL